MYISSFRVKNYKSFNDSGEVEFNKGINIITGQNNAGKTSFIQALSLKFQNRPHASTKVKKNVNVVLNPTSIAEISIIISKNELADLLFNDTRQQVVFPTDHSGVSNDLSNRNVRNEFLSKSLKINFDVKENGSLDSIWLPDFQSPVTGKIYQAYIITPTEDFTKAGSPVSLKNTDNQFYLRLFQILSKRFYFFNAERYHISSFRFGRNKELLSDASNLPEVLMNLQSNNRIRFKKYNELVRKIFPQIYEISVRAKPNVDGEVEIVVWNEDPNMQREDLVVSLEQSGTGLSQVLAILYVVLTSEDPKVIIIDEPNSFLHPGASRKLVEVLKEYPQHQFILTTHSPSTIAASNPKTINIIKNKDAQSYIEPISVNDAKHLQLYLAEIGAKLSDVYGSDNILWVEGKTEEICFPKIIEKTQGVSLMGTSVLAVKSTGDFESKHTKTVFEIYKKLSSGNGLLPPAIGFIFDKENKTQTQIDDLRRQSDDAVVFTERKMFENYLINIKAIEQVLNSIDEISDIEIDEEKIQKWLDDNRWNKEFINQRYINQKNEEEWLKNHDGAKLLNRIFLI